MSSKDQTLAFVVPNDKEVILYIHTSQMLRLTSILEISQAKILNRFLSDPDKANAARTIISSIRETMPKRHSPMYDETQLQAAVWGLQNTPALDALDTVRDWATDLLNGKEQRIGPNQVEVSKKALKWLNSRARNLKFIIC